MSCSEDYDDDIKGLQAQIDAQRASLAEIETLLQSGVVIKDVKSDTNGIKLILSNGNEYVLTHGEDGKDGKDAAVWTIGTDGYWYLNNEKSEYKAIGIDGVDGVCRNHVSYQQNVEKALVRIKKCKTKTRPKKVGFLNTFKKAEACPLYRGRCQSAFLSVLMHLAQT